MTDDAAHDRMAIALNEYGWRNPNRLTRAPEVVRIVCAACGAESRRPPTLGVVVDTTQGLLLRVDHLRRVRLSRDALDENAEYREVGRGTVHLWHFLGDTLDDSARWFATCASHGQRSLPSQAELANAARDRSVARVDL